jgi:hypothetical protein
MHDSPNLQHGKGCLCHLSPSGQEMYKFYTFAFYHLLYSYGGFVLIGRCSKGNITFTTAAAAAAATPTAIATAAGDGGGVAF